MDISLFRSQNVSNYECTTDAQNSCTLDWNEKFTEAVLELGLSVGGDTHRGKGYLSPKLSKICMKLKKLGSLVEHTPGTILSIFDSVCGLRICLKFFNLLNSDISWTIFRIFLMEKFH